VVETEILIAKWSAWRGGRRTFTLALSPESDLCALTHCFSTPTVSLSTHRLFSPSLQMPMIFQISQPTRCKISQVYYLTFMYSSIYYGREDARNISSCT